jgi:hypothetical protein
MLAQFAHKGRVHDLDEVMLLIGEVGTGEQLSAILQNVCSSVVVNYY